jgi:hypothetical protein
MEVLEGLIIGGFALVPFITGLVEVAKKMGMEVEYAPWLTGALSVIGFAIVTYVQPLYPIEVAAVAAATVAFISATASYKVTKASPKKSIAKKSSK